MRPRAIPDGIVDDSLNFASCVTLDVGGVAGVPAAVRGGCGVDAGGRAWLWRLASVCVGGRTGGGEWSRGRRRVLPGGRPAVPVALILIAIPPCATAALAEPNIAVNTLAIVNSTTTTTTTAVLRSQRSGIEALPPPAVQRLARRRRRNSRRGDGCRRGRRNVRGGGGGRMKRCRRW